MHNESVLLRAGGVIDVDLYLLFKRISNVESQTHVKITQFVRPLDFKRELNKMRSTNEENLTFTVQ